MREHLQTVPGRKTDLKDSEWLADLLRHGRLKARFILPAPIRELRELTRQPQDARPGACAGSQSLAQGAAGAPTASWGPRCSQASRMRRRWLSWRAGGYERNGPRCARRWRGA
jgi:Transposase